MNWPLGPGVGPFHFPQVDRDLVDHDQGGLATEKLDGVSRRPGRRASRRPLGRGESPRRRPGGRPAHPRGSWPVALARGSDRRRDRCSRRPSAATRTGPLGSRAGSTNSSTSFDTLHPADSMDQGDEPVGFAAAVLGIQPDDRRDLAALSRQAGQDGLEQLLHPAGRVTMPEEDRRVRVFLGSRLVNDLGQVGGELLVLGRAGLDVGSWTTSFEDRLAVTFRWSIRWCFSNRFVACCGETELGYQCVLRTANTANIRAPTMPSNA